MMKTATVILLLLASSFLASMPIPTEQVFCATMMFQPSAAMEHAREASSGMKSTLALQQEQQQEPIPGDEPAAPAPRTDDPNDPDNFQGNPTHQHPETFCTAHPRPNGVKACMCLKMAPDGCVQGKREVEHKSCASYCWKSLCRCCAS